MRHRLLPVALLAALPPAVRAADLLSEWRSGPVRYLCTAAEDREFRHLQDDPSRRAFIQRFWERRDPTPETGENEAREQFDRRVAEANRLFAETTTPGWRTDQGRIYILLGAPDEREVDPVRKESRGEVRWIYRGSPGQGLGPGQIIAFRADPSGEYRLSTNPDDYRQVMDFITRSSVVFGNSTLSLNAAPLPPVTESEIRDDIGHLTRPPTEDDLLREIVKVQQYPGLVPFLFTFDFYRSEAGLTFVGINLGVERTILPDGTDLNALLPVARLEDMDEPGVAFDFVHRNPFSPAPEDDAGARYLVFQAGHGVPPGRYRTYLGLVDRTRGTVVSRHGEIVVPDLHRDGLLLSSLTLARLAEQAEEQGPYKRPFVLAGRQVVPRLAPFYRNGDTFSLYFQAYGAEPDADGHLDLDVIYQFFLRDGGDLRPVGEPIAGERLREQAVGWSFPLEGWPAAPFRLQVTVTDRNTGRSARETVDFAVDE